MKLNRAKIALNTGNLELATEYGFEALEIFEQKKDTSGQAFALQTIGQNFLQMDDFERALPYLYRSLKYYKVRGNPRRLATIYNDLGINYQELKNNDSALFYYQFSLAKREEINDLLGIPGTRMNIGILMYNQKKYAEAKEILILAREGYAAVEDPKGVLNCNINLGLVAMDEKNYTQALKYYQSAYKGATEIKIENVSRQQQITCPKHMGN